MVMRSQDALNTLKLTLLLAAGSLIATTGLRCFSLPAHSPEKFPLYFYQRIVGDLDGRSCPSYPVCSFYARQAVEKHGLLLGSWLILDRLIHEADDVRVGPRVIVDGRQRLHDPLTRNDFWLKKGERNAW